MPRPCCAELALSLAPCPMHARNQPRPGSGEWVNCPDQLVVWSDQHGYGLPVRDGGDSQIAIEHCPWCGEKLPKP